MTDGTEEDNALKEYADLFEKPIMVPDVDDEDEFVRKVKEMYNRDRGDDVNE